MYTLAFLLICGAHFLTDIAVGIWPLYKTVAGVDLRTAAIIMGFCGFLGEGMQLIFGFFSDRGKRKQIMIMGLMLSTAIFLLGQWQKNLFYFFVMLSVMVGSGAFHPAAAGFVGGLSKQHKGKLILGFAMAGALGQGFSQLFYFSIYDQLQKLWPLILLLVASFAWLLYRFRFSAVEAPSREKLDLKGFLRPFQTKRRPILLLYFSQLVTQGLLYSFLFLLPDLLKEKTCHGWLAFGGGQLCFLLGGSIGLLPVGLLIDRFGPKAVMTTLCLLSFFLFYSLLFLPPGSSSWMIALFLALFGMTCWCINPTILTWGNLIVPESPSFISAILLGLAWCFSHLMTMVSGILATSVFGSSCHSCLQAIGGLILLTLVFALFMPKERFFVPNNSAIE